MMQYGPRCGAPFYREEVAKFLSAQYGDDVKWYLGDSSERRETTKPKSVH